MSPVEKEPNFPGEPASQQLNPLLNPVLGENMGRWAEVYFTSSPGKRQQAVIDLLSELQEHDEPRPPVAADLPLRERSVNTSHPEIVCHACQGKNDADHKFCGMCGTLLAPADAMETSVPPVEIPSAPVLASCVVGARGHLRVRAANRNNAFQGRAQGLWKVMLVVLILILGGTFTYHQWRSFRQNAVPVPRTEPSDASRPVASTQTIRSAPLSAPASRNSARPHGKTLAGKMSTRASATLPRVQLAVRPKGRFVYPASPQSGLAGNVNLKVLIGAEGRVRQVLILSGDHRLAEAAVRAVRLWRYGRQDLNGQPVESEAAVSISFFGADAVSIKFLPPNGISSAEIQSK